MPPPLGVGVANGVGVATGVGDGPTGVDVGWELGTGEGVEPGGGGPPPGEVGGVLPPLPPPPQAASIPEISTSNASFLKPNPSEALAVYARRNARRTGVRSRLPGLFGYIYRGGL